MLVYLMDGILLDYEVKDKQVGIFEDLVNHSYNVVMVKEKLIEVEHFPKKFSLDTYLYFLNQSLRHSD